MSAHGQRAAPFDPDLAAVVAAWPRLPRPLRDVVLALVRSAAKD
jgi:hypothetical protein